MINTLALIRSYAANIDPDQFPYVCVNTGELAPNLRYVIHVTIKDFFQNGRFIYRWVSVKRIQYQQ